MAKAILIMDDVPDYCNDCYAVHMSQNGEFCRAAKEHLQPKAERPDWCPLRELPEKIPDLKHGYENVEKSIIRIGWNACLDTILENALSDSVD